MSRQYEMRYSGTDAWLPATGARQEVIDLMDDERIDYLLARFDDGHHTEFRVKPRSPEDDLRMKVAEQQQEIARLQKELKLCWDWMKEEEKRS